MMSQSLEFSPSALRQAQENQAQGKSLEFLGDRKKKYRCK